MDDVAYLAKGVSETPNLPPATLCANMTASNVSHPGAVFHVFAELQGEFLYRGGNPQCEAEVVIQKTRIYRQQ